MNNELHRALLQMASGMAELSERVGVLEVKRPPIVMGGMAGAHNVLSPTHADSDNADEAAELDVLAYIGGLWRATDLSTLIGEGKLYIGKLEGPHIGLFVEDLPGGAQKLILRAVDTAGVPFFSVDVTDFETNSEHITLGYGDSAERLVLAPSTLTPADPSQHRGMLLPASARTRYVNYAFGSGSAPITPGIVPGPLHLPFGGTLTAWALLCDAPGTIRLDLWKSTYAAFQTGVHPADADSMCPGLEPATVASDKAQSAALAGWATTTLAAGDVIRVNVDANDTVPACTLSLTIVT
jgi:hypothetical protein